MSLWFKHDAHFHEHPKCIRLRRLAGSKADSAEVGWWRIVAAAKRLGEWSFDDEDHLRDVSGRYFGFVRLYREVGLLDHLTIHNAEEYQGPASGAQRQAKHRHVRNAASVTPVVTPVTPREEKSREEQSRASRDDDKDPDWLVAWWQIGRRKPPTEGQQAFIDAYLRAFDVSGISRLTRLFLQNPTDPIGAAKDDLSDFRRERAQAAAEAERTPKRRSHGLPPQVQELARLMAEVDRTPKDDAA